MIKESNKNGEQRNYNQADSRVLNWKSITDINILRSLAVELTQANNRVEALEIYETIINIDYSDLNSRFNYALLQENGTHKNMARARDIMLSILDENPIIFDITTEHNIFLIRSAAYRCHYLGPISRAIELFQKLSTITNNADDFATLSEVLAKENKLPEAISALKKAMDLNPDKYDNETSNETILAYNSNIASTYETSRDKIKTIVGRYPLNEDFHGDIQTLIKKHIASNFTERDKFINNKTKFYTMGSCFARNIHRSLLNNGFQSYHMEISETINTTFANRAFIDWLDNKSQNTSITKRFEELLPSGSSSINTIEIIKNSDVFILTLGVAYAFFDKINGEFVLPRPTQLNSRALAEKYDYRLTSVSENIENVQYLISYIRKISPNIKVIVTVSPVPIIASFGHPSCVQADCLSKSTMRLVADQIVNASGIKEILYWPSFEIFRWAGSSSSNYYAADDGASWHVSEDKVGQTIASFIDIFSA